VVTEPARIVGAHGLSIDLDARPAAAAKPPRHIDAHSVQPRANRQTIEDDDEP
jgi:hypothetical protein